MSKCAIPQIKVTFWLFARKRNQYIDTDSTFRTSVKSLSPEKPAARSSLVTLALIWWGMQRICMPSLPTASESGLLSPGHLGELEESITEKPDRT